MIHVRKSEDRGQAEVGWLSSRHTFSFSDYHDPKHMGFSVLRVINEDYIQGGTGFSTHGHKDMEIISYVVEGALEHKDSMGNTTIIKPGDVQRMSAGTGVRHSEKNNIPDKTTHLLQIWIQPEQIGVTPSYAQKSFTDDFACSDIILVASKLGRGGSITLNQDADMYVCHGQEQGEKKLKTFMHRHIWVQVVKGDILVDGTSLKAGDGAGIKKVELVHLQWSKNSEFLVFDLP